MGKNFLIVIALVLAFAINIAIAQEKPSNVLNDVWTYGPDGNLVKTTGDGNGSRTTILEKQGFVRYQEFYPAIDPSTKGGHIKYAVPFYGNAESGVLIADGSTQFVCFAGRPSKPDIKVVATTGPNGTSPITCDFPYQGDGSAELWNFRILKDGKEGQGAQNTTSAWDQFDTLLGLPDNLNPRGDKHPYGMMFVKHVVVDGWTVSSAYPRLKDKGFQRAQEWAITKGYVKMAGGPVWRDFNIATGVSSDKMPSQFK